MKGPSTITDVEHDNSSERDGLFSHPSTEQAQPTRPTREHAGYENLFQEPRHAPPPNPAH